MLWEGVVFGVYCSVGLLVVTLINFHFWEKKTLAFLKGLSCVSLKCFYLEFTKKVLQCEHIVFMRRTCCVPPRACPVLLSLIESVFVYFLFLNFESNLTEWPTSASLLLSHNSSLFSSFYLTGLSSSSSRLYTDYTQPSEHPTLHLFQNYMFINSNLGWIHKYGDFNRQENTTLSEYYYIVGIHCFYTS